MSMFVVRVFVFVCLWLCACACVSQARACTFRVYVRLCVCAAAVSLLCAAVVPTRECSGFAVLGASCADCGLVVPRTREHKSYTNIETFGLGRSLANKHITYI